LVCARFRSADARIGEPRTSGESLAKGCSPQERTSSITSRHLTSTNCILSPLQYAIDIEHETKRHNRLLDETVSGLGVIAPLNRLIPLPQDDDFGANFVFLGNTRNRLNRLLISNRSPKFTCYLSLAICSLLFLLYFILSARMK